jgi:zinc finger FYVE domain-containing protein 26
VHFDEGLLARQQSGETTKGVTKASRGKLPSQKLTEDELIKFTSRVAIQVRILIIISEQVINVSSTTGNKYLTKISWVITTLFLISILLSQIEVVRAFGDSEGPPWKHSLFGNPNESDTVK